MEFDPVRWAVYLIFGPIALAGFFLVGSLYRKLLLLLATLMFIEGVFLTWRPFLLVGFSVSSALCYILLVSFVLVPSTRSRMPAVTIQWAAFLAGAPGKVVAAVLTGMHAAPDVESNLTMVMSFPDGSRATLCYGSSGHRALPKERIEVSWDGHSAVIDDFKSLECHGIGRSQRMKVQDKGIASHLGNFVSALHGRADLVSPETAGLDAAERIDEARACLRREAGS